MQAIFKKTSHERNDILFIRNDGSREEARDLESRSYLRHDLMHYVVESRAGLRGSFYGSIAAGKSLTEIRPPARLDAADKQAMAVGEGGLTELVVAMLQGAHREDFDGEELLKRVPEYFSAQGFDVPAYLTPGFIEIVAKEFRFLLRTYEGLSTGESMTLEF